MRAPPATRQDYRAFVRLQTRWSDNDAYGHMNNAAYLQLVDTAVSLWQLENGIAIQGTGAHRFVVVESGLRYHSELGFPDPVTAGLRVGHLGSSSLRFDVGLFRGEDETASAEGHFAMVLTDPDAKPIPIPPGLRSIFEGIAA